MKQNFVDFGLNTNAHLPSGFDILDEHFCYSFTKKFQKKKKKIFTCEVLVAAYFDLRSNKIPKNFDEKYFVFEKFLNSKK